MNDKQRAALREELLTADINPSWSGYSSLRDMFYYFCTDEGEGYEDGDRNGPDVVMGRLMDIIEHHVKSWRQPPS